MYNCALFNIQRAFYDVLTFETSLEDVVQRLTYCSALDTRVVSYHGVFSQLLVASSVRR